MMRAMVALREEKFYRRQKAEMDLETGLFAALAVTRFALVRRWVVQMMAGTLWTG